MGRLSAIIITIIIMIVIGGISKIVSDTKKSKEKAKYEDSLSPELKDLRNTIFQEYFISNSSTYPSYPRVIIFKEEDHNTKIFEELYNLLPNKIKSKDTKTINTAILYRTGEIKAGNYTNGGYAIKRYVELTFINLITRTVFHTKRIEGGEPPNSINVKAGSRQNGYGRNVSNREVIDYIIRAL